MIFAAKLKAVRAMFFMNLALVLTLPFLGLVDPTYTGYAISTLLYYTFGAAGIVATFHRFYSHNSYKFKYKWTEYLFTMLGTLSGSGSALGWAAMHRVHHKHPDTEQDPHSPIHGAWDTLTVKYSYGKEKVRQIKDLLKKPFVVWTHKYYFLILMSYIALLYGVAGVEGMYYGFAVPSVITMLVSGFTNYVSHIPWLGYQRHKDAGQSTNAWWTTILNCGEGWHNNHHHNPKSFTTKEKWYEWDMAGTIIRAVKQ
jgi:stearoyl-CoA desaturase (delta-9 desaturase)